LSTPTFDFLDGVVTFSRDRDRQRLYPAVEPLRSWSLRLRDAAPGDDHRTLAEEAQRVLLRYDDLHDQYEHKGFDSLFYLDNL
jgi:F-type H+-transporting ATPase subunit beta